MSPIDPIVQFSAKNLGGRTVPGDLGKLLEWQWRDAAGGRDNRLKRAGVTLVDNGPPKLVVAACAGRDDLGGATRLAHTQAMADMVRYSAFVAEDDTTRDAIGYWFGPDRIPIEIAPLLRFDTNFNFSIVPGNNITEAILVVASRGDDQKFCELRGYLNELGLDIAAQSIHDVQPRECAILPQATYEQLVQTYSADLSAASVTDIGGPGEFMTVHRGPKIDLETD
jgi:hypothetical protein